VTVPVPRHRREGRTERVPTLRSLHCVRAAAEASARDPLAVLPQVLGRVVKGLGGTSAEEAARLLGTHLAFRGAEYECAPRCEGHPLFGGRVRVGVPRPRHVRAPHATLAVAVLSLGGVLTSADLAVVRGTDVHHARDGRVTVAVRGLRPQTHARAVLRSGLNEAGPLVGPNLGASSVETGRGAAVNSR